MRQSKKIRSIIAYVAFILTAAPFCKLSSVQSISPNPSERYVAHVNITDDGNTEFSYKRRVTLVEARFAAHDDKNPTEETLNGYSIVYNRTSKMYEYATLASGDLRASGIPVVRGQPPPRGRFKKHLARTASGLAKVAMQPASNVTRVQVNKSLYGGTGGKAQLKVLVIPILFADHTASSRWRPTKDQLTTLFNARGGNRQLAPTGSIKDVFLTMSHNKLNLTATVTGWVQVSKPESYYAARNRGYTAQFMHEALSEALDTLDNTFKFPFNQFDSDKDGIIDFVCFVHSGYGAEFGGISKDGAYFMDRIWSHKWTMHWTSSRQNVGVSNYVIAPSTHGAWPSGTPSESIVRVGVIAHEIGHSLGINVDLDDTDGHGIGHWDLMGSAWGFDATQYCVPLMSPWTKLQMGWIAPKQITSLDSGKTLSLVASAESNANYYMISQGYPSG